jgi:hypothetical protein
VSPTRKGIEEVGKSITWVTSLFASMEGSSDPTLVRAKGNEIYGVKASECYIQDAIDVITVYVNPCMWKVCSLKQFSLMC